MTKQLEFQDVWKTYPDGGQVLKGLTFSISRGEIALIVGENGAGKSTILDIASGNLQIDSGSVHLRGRSISRKPPELIHQLGVRRMYQTPGTFDSLTILDNVLISHCPSHYSAFAPWTQASEREQLWRMVRQTAAPLFEVCAFLNEELALTSSLSFGERRIIDFLGTTSSAGHSDVLLLDEPFAGINAAVTDVMWQMMEGLSAGGLSILLVEHTASEIRFAQCRQIRIAEGIAQ
jgi:ABC-type branched-subunit amino acid transport system ATPase component